MKQWYQSKTVWLAIAQGTLAVILVFIENNPEMGYLLLAKTFLDIFIRYITKGEIVRF